MIEEAEELGGFKYDTILRSRADVWLHEPTALPARLDKWIYYPMSSSCIGDNVPKGRFDHAGTRVTHSHDLIEYGSRHVLLEAGLGTRSRNFLFS